MARKSQAFALHLLRTVYNATDRPMQWRSLEGLDVPETAEARQTESIASAPQSTSCPAGSVSANT